MFNKNKIYKPSRNNINLTYNGYKNIKNFNIKKNLTNANPKNNITNTNHNSLYKKNIKNLFHKKSLNQNLKLSSYIIYKKVFNQSNNIGKYLISKRNIIQNEGNNITAPNIIIKTKDYEKAKIKSIPSNTNY